MTASTWQNPLWGSLTGPDGPALRAIFQSLSTYVAPSNVTGGAGIPDDGVAPATPPQPDVNITAPFTAFMSWTPNTEPDMSNGFGYYLIDTFITEFGVTAATQQFHNTFASFTLPSNLHFKWRVKAVDAHGNESGWSVYSDVIQVPKVATGDVKPLNITSTLIADDSISTPKLQANSVTANILATSIALVSGFISSTTYTTGSAGWAILADGTAEFNNLVARGELATGFSPDPHIRIYDGGSYGRMDLFVDDPALVDPAVIFAGTSGTGGRLTLQSPVAVGDPDVNIVLQSDGTERFITMGASAISPELGGYFKGEIPGAKLHTSSSQTITKSPAGPTTFHTLGYITAELDSTDTWNFFDALNDQFVVPTGFDGLYLATYVVEWEIDSVGMRQVRFVKNSGPIPMDAQLNNGIFDQWMNGGTELKLAAGDTVKLQVAHTSTLAGGLDVTDSRFTLRYQGQV